MATRDRADAEKVQPDVEELVLEEVADEVAEDEQVFKIVGEASFVAESPAADAAPVVLLETVRPGDSDGHAAWIARLLGQGDSNTYGESQIAGVKERQVAAGLEPDGIVGTATWPLVLPVLRHGDRGPEVGVLRSLLGLPRFGEFSADVESGVKFLQAENALERDGVCSKEVWAVLLGNGAVG